MREQCFSAECLVNDLYKEHDRMKSTQSDVEIRLYDHSTNKAFYKRLSELELQEIKKVLEIEQIK